jgi:hypothetical protein
MESSVYNICWEFCYEVIPACVSGEKNPNLLILNLPIEFSVQLESLLSKKGYRCTRFQPHGEAAVIMRFRKVPLVVEN